MRVQVKPFVMPAMLGTAGLLLGGGALFYPDAAAEVMPYGFVTLIKLAAAIVVGAAGMQLVLLMVPGFAFRTQSTLMRLKDPLLRRPRANTMTIRIRHKRKARA